MLGFDTCYVCAKFGEPSFRPLVKARCRHITGAPKFEVGHATPLLWAFCYSYAGT